MFLLTEIRENFLKALDISWKGILSIFIAMTIIYIAIYILNKVTKKEEDK